MMKNDTFISELKETKKRKKQHPSLTKGVQSFVRFHFEEIMEAKEELTWNEIAEILKKFNIVWGNGSPVSGKDLRSIVSRLKVTLSYKEEKEPSKFKPQKSSYRDEDTEDIKPKKIKDFKNSSAKEEESKGKTKPKNINLVLEEMRRSTAERRS